MAPPEPPHIQSPTAAAAPLVPDPPHCGSWLVPDLPPATPERDLRKPEDLIVDRLWADAPARGAALLTAGLWRVRIDPHRRAGDGECLHLNCRSVRATAGTRGEGSAGIKRADNVLGNRDGPAAHPPPSRWFATH